MTLIGLYSPAKKSGKSEVARVLTNEFGYTNVKFAEPLKNMTRAFFKSMGMGDKEIERYVEGELKELPVTGLRIPISSRFIQDTVGTDWGRETLYEDVWVDITKARIRQIRDKTRKTLDKPRVVVDDVRFANEFEAIKELGGKVVRIVRPGYTVEHDRMKYDGMLEGFPFDEEILNNGTLAQLHAAAMELAR